MGDGQYRPFTSRRETTTHHVVVYLDGMDAPIVMHDPAGVVTSTAYQATGRYGVTTSLGLAHTPSSPSPPDWGKAPMIQASIVSPDGSNPAVYTDVFGGAIRVYTRDGSGAANDAVGLMVYLAITV